MIFPITILAITLVGVSGAAFAATSASTPSASPSADSSPLAPAGVGTDVWSTLAGQVMSDLNSGKFDDVQKMSDATMQQALPAGKLSDAWTSITGQVGSFQSIVSTEVIEQPPYHVVVADCKFDKMDLDTTISFDDDKHLAGIFFKPHEQAEPAAVSMLPAGLTETAVTVGEGGKWPLPGTLTLPSGSGPFPAVVLVHGSGPNDQDETIGSNKPFRDLAWGLAQHGIAVLRYDKRTDKYRAQVMKIPTFTVDDETTDDAVLAAKLLRQSPQVDPKEIFVIGHSLGAMLIPRIASHTPFAAGYVVMAAPTSPLEDDLLEQIMARSKDLPAAQSKKIISEFKVQVAAVKSPSLSEKTPASKLPFNVPASYWLDLRNYHAAELAKAIPQPLLVLQGGADFQVPPANLSVWKTTLADKKSVAYHLYPGLSHLFMAGQPSPTDYYSHPGHVDAEVISEIADWIKSVDANR